MAIAGTLSEEKMAKRLIATTDIILGGLMAVSIASPFVFFELEQAVFSSELEQAVFFLFVGSVLAPTLFFAVPLT